MLQTVFRKMSANEVKTLLKSVKTEKKLYEPELQTALFGWTKQIPASASFNAQESLGRLLKAERFKFEVSANLWTKICEVFEESYGLNTPSVEPTPEQTVNFLTFSELSALLQSLEERVFLSESKSKLMITPPKKRWPDYMTKVRRLRNEAAHLRNISFQDIEDLLRILDSIRRDQIEFLIIE